MATVVFNTGDVGLFGCGDFDELDALRSGFEAVQAAGKDAAALAGASSSICTLLLHSRYVRSAESMNIPSN